MTRRSLAAAPISRRRLAALGIGAALAAAAGIVARVGYVNATAVPVPPVIRYPMGEWVELDGAFVSTSSLEQTEEYALRVTDAQVISPRSYIERYTVVSSPLDETTALEGDITGIDAPSLICLTIDIRNEGSDGQLCFADMYLVPERKNEYFMPDVPLFISSEAQYAEAGATAASAYIGVRPGTEYTIHLPYTHGSLVDGNWVHYDTGYLNPVVDRSFELILSYLPVRRVVDVSVA